LGTTEGTAETIRIQCPRCHLTKDWPADEPLPLCGDCRFKLGGRIVSMRRISNEKTVEGAPDLPEGLLPFEATAVAWIRQQKAAVWPDLRDLAEAIKQGDHHLSRRSSNVYVMRVEGSAERQK
jgi:hypothetical protein